MLLWLLGHALYAAWWSWVLWGGGARWLEGSWLSGFLVSLFAPRWSEDGIRLFALLMLCIGGVSFIAELLYPQWR
ncbi:hypothetical protein [Stenotrophomonas sp. YIM B06876]|uniref:hypothetical protein n=1 Tax=Stenotrophomonas sp. YIM B06876 TaxID=3060211 RepID=UPI0027390588|nr:hypothetical protein [Stenotrophomonas sp. YIM B06876]